jgi:hypothetical protein
MQALVALTKNSRGLASSPAPTPNHTTHPSRRKSARATRPKTARMRVRLIFTKSRRETAIHSDRGSLSDSNETVQMKRLK